MRLILGQLQVLGAIAAFLLLLKFGVTSTVIWLAGGTGLVSLLSVFLFRVLKIETQCARRDCKPPLDVD
jgi:hypothetical protein